MSAVKSIVSRFLAGAAIAGFVGYGAQQAGDYVLPESPVMSDFDPLGEELTNRKRELEEQFRGITRVIGDDYRGRCLTGNQVRDFSEGKRARPADLTDNQQLLIRLYDERRNTAMGRYINQSQKDFNTVTCVQDQPRAGYLGLYADWVNVATVNLGRIDGGAPASAAQVMTDQRLMNLALRTSYEEMAHAWQGNTQKSISAPHEAHALHLTMWTLAVEAQAKLVTFMALAELRERGDAGPWNSAISGRTTDRAQMEALQAVLDANPDMKILEIAREQPEALCPVFRAFFTDPMPRQLYEGHIAGFTSRSTAATEISNDDFIAQRGALPGLKSNFLAACDVSINDPELVRFFDKNAETMVRRSMQRAGADPARFGL